MEMKALEEKENHLLGRKEVKFEINHLDGASPAKSSVSKELAAKYNVPEDHIVIDYIFTRKGIASSEVHAKIYDEKPKIKEKKSKEAKGAKEEKVEKTEEKKVEAQVSKPA